MTHDYQEHGGYDCMTAAFIIRNEKKEKIAVIDLADFGQQSCQPPSAIMLKRAENYARLMSTASDLLLACEFMLNARSSNELLKASAEMEKAVRKAKGIQ